MIRGHLAHDIISGQLISFVLQMQSVREHYYDHTSLNESISDRMDGIYLGL